MASLNSSYDSLSDAEKRAIESLILLKEKPVIFKRSRLGMDYTEDATHSQDKIKDNGGSPNGRVSHSNDVKMPPVVINTETRVSLRGSTGKRRRDVSHTLDYHYVQRKELHLVHNHNKGDSKNKSDNHKKGDSKRKSDILKDNKISRVEHNLDSEDEKNPLIDSAGSPNDMFSNGKIGIFRDIKTWDSPHEDNRRKKKQAPKVDEGYRNTKEMQLEVHQSNSENHKIDVDNIHSEKIYEKELTFGKNDGPNLDDKEAKTAVVGSPPSIGRSKLSNYKSRAKSNDNGGAREGQAKKNGKGGRDKRVTAFTGVTDYRRTGKWQAYIWISNGYQRSLGYYYVSEAAARASDKAHLVLRSPSRRKLNYPETDYDMKRIEEWKKLSEEDFVQLLCNQSGDHSEACIDGLNAEAALHLLEAINKEKQARFLLPSS